MIRHGYNEAYVIPRPGCNGSVILGGYIQSGNGDGATYAPGTASILHRVRKPSSELSESEPDILAVVASPYLSRDDGARVERDAITIATEDRVTVHNYGAGGTGSQAGHDMALESMASIENILASIYREDMRAKL